MDRARPRVAIAMLFFVNGAVFASWVSRIPGVKAGLRLSDARLGVALSALGLGTVASLPVTTAVLSRLGSCRVAILSAFACCAGLPLAGSMTTLGRLALALALLGACLGSMDVAMNAQASLLERAAGRSIMSSLHGLWSLGGLVGSSCGGALAARGFSPLHHFLIVGAALASAVLAVAGLLGENEGRSRSPSPLAWPSASVVAIGWVGACGAIVEGGIADWSGVYLRDCLGTGLGASASGFAVFSTAMMLGRFAADPLIDRFGRPATLRFGSALTGLAILTALLAGRPPVAIAAFALAGLGTCTVFPIAFGAAGSVSGSAPGPSIAVVATMAYGAGLVAPPLIGFAAGATSLPAALGLLVLASGAIVLLARNLEAAQR
jgi:fucose permease